MIDTDLVEGIRSMLVNANCRELDGETAAYIADNVAKHFRINTHKVYWWEGIGVPALLTNYENANGIDLVRKIVEGNPQVILFVTDDESIPWPAFVGLLDKILFVISEQRFFEYFLVPESLEWIIFDTHDNTLISSGIGKPGAGLAL